MLASPQALIQEELAVAARDGEGFVKGGGKHVLLDDAPAVVADFVHGLVERLEIH